MLYNLLTHMPARRHPALRTRVRELRKRAGLTQEELAARSGLTQSHLSRIELGKYVPTLGTLERLARALKMPVSELLP